LLPKLLHHCYRKCCIVVTENTALSFTEITAFSVTVTNYLRSDVQEWLNRPLEGYYPIVLVDAIHIKIHRKRSVATEAFYVVLGVKEDKKREVLGIYNRPTESAAGWEDIFRDVQSRGAGHIGLLVSDGLTGLDSALSVVYPKTLLQRCVTHLKRNMLSKVRHGDKMELAEDLREVFRTGQKDYTKCEAWQNWTALCQKWGKDYRSIKRMGEDISVIRNTRCLHALNRVLPIIPHSMTTTIYLPLQIYFTR
jgi:putative transposase